ncbi:hypothetical protein Tco_0287445 [Tanacetum coccineum]
MLNCSSSSEQSFRKLEDPENVLSHVPLQELDRLLLEVSSNFEEGRFSIQKRQQNESSITFSLRNDPLHHEFAGEVITLPSRNDREFEEYFSLMTVLCEISTSQSQENVHANQSLIIESLPVSPIPVEDSEPAQE